VKYYSLKIVFFISIVGMLAAAEDNNEDADSLKGKLTIISTPMFIPVLRDHAQTVAGRNSNIRIRIIKQKARDQKIAAIIEKEKAAIIVLTEEPSPKLKRYKIRRIAVKGICFIVNKGNPIKTISKAEITNIYTGKLTNWKALGLNSQTLYFACPPSESDEWRIFKSKVLPATIRSSPEKSFQIIKDKAAMPEFVKKNKNSLGIISIIEDVDGVKRIPYNNRHATTESIESGEYPLEYQFFMLCRQPTDDVAKYFQETLLSPDNTDLFRQNGFILLNQKDVTEE